MDGDEALPLLGLAGFEEGEEIVRVEGEHAVPSLRIAGYPAMMREVVCNEVLEGLLEMNAHIQAAPGMGISPLTVAEINACRFSFSSLSCVSSAATARR